MVEMQAQSPVTLLVQVRLNQWISNPIKHAHVIIGKIFMEIVCQLLDMTHSGACNGFCLLVSFTIRQPNRTDMTFFRNNKNGGKKVLPSTVHAVQVRGCVE